VTTVPQTGQEARSYCCGASSLTGYTNEKQCRDNGWTPSPEQEHARNLWTQIKSHSARITNQGDIETGRETLVCPTTHPFAVEAMVHTDVDRVCVKSIQSVYNDVASDPAVTFSSIDNCPYDGSGKCGPWPYGSFTTGAPIARPDTVNPGDPGAEDPDNPPNSAANNWWWWLLLALLLLGALLAGLYYWWKKKQGAKLTTPPSVAALPPASRTAASTAATTTATTVVTNQGNPTPFSQASSQTPAQVAAEAGNRAAVTEPFEVVPPGGRPGANDLSFLDTLTPERRAVALQELENEY